MKTKKVLFTSHVANFQKFNRPFMRWFRDQGWEVHYASMGEEEILDCDKSFVVPFTRSPFKLDNVKSYNQLKEIIDRENYDIIHTHTPMGSVVTRLAARDARRCGTRVIYTAHGFHFFTGAPLANWLIYYPVEKWMARHTDTLITINNEDYERAKRRFKTDVQYVPGVGIDENRFTPRLTKKQRNDLRKSIGIKPDDFVMIYPAELSKRKNQTMLIEVMEQLVRTNKGVHLLLVGKGSMDGIYKKAVSKMGLQRHVHFLGYRTDVPRLLMASDISVSTSLQEGLPVHVMEAMAAGLPVVSTNCRGAIELIEHEKNGLLINAKDRKGLLGSIEVYRDDASEYRKASRASRDASRRYSLESIIIYMARIYEKST